MSRVGKYPVAIPAGVTVSKADGAIVAKGKLGELSFGLSDLVDVSVNDNEIVTKPVNDSQQARAMWGTTRARIRNLVLGVSNGYTRKLEIVGVGYRAAVQGSILKLALGYSHDVDYPIPQGISIKCETPTVVEISGADKQRVGQVAAEIRAYRSPEPYKGKGIKYAGEQILRKEGKKK